MEIVPAAYEFQMDGAPVACEEFGHGHINSTYKITTDAGHEYVLQKINKYVFHNPVQLMANANAVTSFIREREADPRAAIHFIPTRNDDGSFCHRDSDGEFWRMYDYVGGFCVDQPETDEDFYQSAVAFGRFQHLLAGFPADTLYETIPNFHNTVDRYRQLEESIRQDLEHRVKRARQEIAFALDRKEKACSLQRMRESGELPLRVTHNDTKLNNVLLDRNTRKALCVLDLDTVMPGLSAYDFGDSIRFGAATAAEDAKDPSTMKLDLHLFEVYTRGFLSSATALTDKEVAMLPLGAYIMTMECGIRFLKDFLDGDLYFKTAYRDHNLVRCRTQLALAADMEIKWEDMQRIVADVAHELRG